jgi:hypothetical protein
VEYKITLDQAEETVTAKQLLSLDPLQIELYNQLTQWKAPFLNFKHDEFSKKIKLMIIDYFEIQHSKASLIHSFYCAGIH